MRNFLIFSILLINLNSVSVLGNAGSNTKKIVITEFDFNKSLIGRTGIFSSHEVENYRSGKVRGACNSTSALGLDKYLVNFENIYSLRDESVNSNIRTLQDLMEASVQDILTDNNYERNNFALIALKGIVYFDLLQRENLNTFVMETESYMIQFYGVKASNNRDKKNKILYKKVMALLWSLKWEMTHFPNDLSSAIKYLKPEKNMLLDIKSRKDYLVQMGALSILDVVLPSKYRRSFTYWVYLEANAINSQVVSNFKSININAVKKSYLAYRNKSIKNILSNKLDYDVHQLIYLGYALSLSTVVTAIEKQQIYNDLSYMASKFKDECMQDYESHNLIDYLTVMNFLKNNISKVSTINFTDLLQHNLEVSCRLVDKYSIARLYTYKEVTEFSKNIIELPNDLNLINELACKTGVSDGE